MDYPSFFNQFHPLELNSINSLLSRCIPKTARKGDLITAEGSIQRELLLVEEGIQMSYYTSEEGKQHVMAFTYPPSLSGIPNSFFFQKPSAYTLQALTDSVFKALPYQALMELFEEDRQIERLFRRITEFTLAGMIDRHLELHAYSIEQRFRLFAQRSPHLFQLIPHKYIANYLHIDPTNFSKLFNSIRI